MTNSSILNSNFSKAASKPPEQKSISRPAPFSLRLNEGERQRLERDAKGKPLGRYIKSRLFNAEAPVRQDMAKALGLLGQSDIADNLMRLADEAHSGSLLLDEQTLLQIDEALRHVAEMRSCLIRALGLMDGG